MPLEKFHNVKLPAAADMHVHLRENEVCEIVTRTIRQGGVNTVYVRQTKQLAIHVSHTK